MSFMVTLWNRTIPSFRKGLEIWRCSFALATVITRHLHMEDGNGFEESELMILHLEIFLSAANEKH
jgi:hypothetical protein